ncbi:MAG: calcium-binding protein, partial [Candidatus Eremiobacterota bacterium]
NQGGNQGGNTGQPAFTVTRESLDSAAQQANGRSRAPWLSPDGNLVAFDSEASNLVAGDTNGARDVFVRDRQTGVTTRVSLSSSGVQGDQGSSSVTVSADGRFAVFESLATNLVPNDSNGVGDVFLHDRQTATTTRVSVDSVGTQGNGLSGAPGISADGRLVVFDSIADNLVPNDTNGVSDVFLHDRQTGATTRISLDSAGNQADGQSGAPFISADGGIVVFESDASNLVPGDTNGVADIFARNLVTGATTRVSVDSAGNQQNAASGADFREVVCSGDGRFVAFTSFATNLVNPPTNGFPQVYLHDRQTGLTRLISADAAGNPGTADSALAFASLDGRFVTFESDASNLVPNDTNGVSDLFMLDLQTGTLQRLSVDATGAQGNGASGRGVFSGDGRFVGYESNASNLVPDDTNGATDGFLVRNPALP